MGKNYPKQRAKPRQHVLYHVDIEELLNNTTDELITKYRAARSTVNYIKRLRGVGGGIAHCVQCNKIFLRSNNRVSLCNTCRQERAFVSKMMDRLLKYMDDTRTYLDSQVKVYTDVEYTQEQLTALIPRA